MVNFFFDSVSDSVELIGADGSGVPVDVCSAGLDDGAGSWAGVVGALGGRKGEVVAYEAVQPWATGVGLMNFTPALAA